jgi:hypothetical protein
MSDGKANSIAEGRVIGTLPIDMSCGYFTWKFYVQILYVHLRSPCIPHVQPINLFSVSLL